MTLTGEQIFDFVIVGAGSAGCVLAERLSANGRHSVCLLEAGGSDRRLIVQMPLGYGKTFYNKSLNWGYRAEPDAGLSGRADYWPRGKVLGGSSSINAMVWIRGAHQDFEDWAAEGNAGWGFTDVLPFFKALEHNQSGADAWRATGGPLHICDVSGQLHPLAGRFIQAGVQMGFAHNADFNGATQEGVGIYQINTKDGWRMSAAKAFLRPALARKNLTLMKNTHALKLLITDRRAVGVEVLHRGTKLGIQARREIILCAGAVNSPQLLQVSGIGDAAHLTELGIQLVQHSTAVGRNLQDHLGINYTYRAKVPTLNDLLRPWWGKARAGLHFLARGRGPLSLSLNQGGGFVKTRPELERPNIQLYMQAISTYHAKQGTRPLLTPDPFPGFSLGLSSCKPASRGQIMIDSPDPLTPPKIRPNAYGAQEDIETMLEGVKLLRNLAGQPALADIISGELAPGPHITSDTQLIEDFRLRSGTVYHPCGTCRMGPDIASAVVDSRLRVMGVAGLRVADASIFPSIISGNTNAPTMMVAAKAGKMILDDHS